MHIHYRTIWSTHYYGTCCRGSYTIQDSLSEVRSKSLVQAKFRTTPIKLKKAYKVAATRDWTRDLQIFSLTLSQLSYRGYTFTDVVLGQTHCFGSLLTCVFRSFSMLKNWIKRRLFWAILDEMALSMICSSLLLKTHEGVLTTSAASRIRTYAGRSHLISSQTP